MLILGIEDFFIDVLSKLLYGLTQGFFTILYWLERVFKVLAGAAPIPGGGTQDSYSILDVVVGDDTIQKILAIFFAIGIGLFVVSLCVGIIRANLKKDSPGESKKVLASSLKALLFFVFVPTLFVIATRLSGQLIMQITNNVGNAVTGSSNTTAQNSIANSLFKQLFDSKFSQTFSHHPNLTFQSSYGELTEAGINMKFNANNFQYVIAIVVSAIMFWTIGISTISLAERIINVVILYVISPVVIASVPLDGGQRMSVWKDKVITKLFGVMGDILSMYIFVLVIGLFGNIIQNSNQATTEEHWLLTFIYAVVCIGGAMMCCKGHTLVASLISQQQGQEEGLSTMTTAQLAGQGMNLAAGGIKLALGGAVGATMAAAKGLTQKGLGTAAKGVGSTLGNAAKGAAGGGGGASPIGNTAKLAAAGGGNATGGGESANALSNPTKLQSMSAKGGLAGLAAGGAGLAIGAGKLLSSPIRAVAGGIANKRYQNKMNKTADGKKLSKNDPGRMSYLEAKKSRMAEKEAQKNSNGQLEVGKKSQQSARQKALTEQATQRGQERYLNQQLNKEEAFNKKQDLRAEKILNSSEQYKDLKGEERDVAKKEIIASFSQGHSSQTFDQKISAALKKHDQEKNRSTRITELSNNGGEE